MAFYEILCIQMNSTEKQMKIFPKYSSFENFWRFFDKWLNKWLIICLHLFEKLDWSAMKG